MDITNTPKIICTMPSDTNNKRTSLKQLRQKSRAGLKHFVPSRGSSSSANVVVEDDSSNNNINKATTTGAARGVSSVPHPPPGNNKSSSQQQQQQQQRQQQQQQQSATKYSNSRSSTRERHHSQRFSPSPQPSPDNNKQTALAAQSSSQPRRQKEQTNNNSNNNNNMTSSTTTTNNNKQQLQTIQSIYGPTTNIYTDVLNISQNATSSEIREAFFCLRYDVYQKLDDAGGGGVVAGGGGNDYGKKKIMTSEERKLVEMKMDAITAAFHILSDDGRRKEYDTSLNDQQQQQQQQQKKGGGGGGGDVSMDISQETDDMGFPINTTQGNNSRTQRASSSGSNNNNNNNVNPSTNHLPIGQRRSVLRRNRVLQNRGAGVGGGMNEGRRIVAKDVSALTSGGLNTRPTPQATSSEVTLNDAGLFGGDSLAFDEDFKLRSSSSNNNNNNKSRSSTMMEEDTRDDLRGGSDWHHQPQQHHQENEGGVNNLNARERLRGSRLNSRYDTTQELSRGDNKFNKAPPNNNNLTSPTGVEEFDNSNNVNWSRSKASGSRGVSNHNQIRRPSPTTTTNDDSLHQRGGINDMKNGGGGSGSVASKTDDDDEDLIDEDDDTRASSMYDDDTHTYDDGTYADETTLGETIDDTTLGESTWASYDDDESYISKNTNNDGGKFSPGHKKGTKPAPILKSGLKKKDKNKDGSMKRSDSDGNSKRVTIHSHRGKGEVNEEDFTLFDDAGALCPTIPSFSMIHEEINGTYKDFTSALHQVSTSFVISPDDIDRMADKIRDAKIELGENYQKQMKDRTTAQDATAPVVVPQEKFGDGGGGDQKKKNMTGKTTAKSGSSQKHIQSKKKTSAV